MPKESHLSVLLLTMLIPPGLIFPQMLPGKHLLIHQSSGAEDSSIYMMKVFLFPTPGPQSLLIDPIWFTIPVPIILRSWFLCLPH